MTISEIEMFLSDYGIVLPQYTLRRKIDAFLPYPTRNNKSNVRDLTKEEFQRLLVALAIEIKTNLPDDEIAMYLNGNKPKVELMRYVVNSSKVDMFLQEWIER